MVRYRFHVLNNCILNITQKHVISFQTASISELECKLFLLPVSAAILNLLYINGRIFTHIRCARVSSFTVNAELYEICVGTLSYKGVT